MTKFFTDPSSRLTALIEALAPKFRQRFLEVVASIKAQVDLDSIQALLEAGDVGGALVSAEVAALRMSNYYGDVMTIVAEDTAEVIGDALQVIVNYDQANTGAIAAMQANQLRLVREFTDEQRLATQEALLDGIKRGLNPRETAIAIRDSIGLTQYQQRIINNYRDQLQNMDRRALDRSLRDKRFDRTVLGSIDKDKALTQAQIDKMVSRYTERWVKYRSEVISRTETLRAAHEGSHEMYRQAINNGTLNADDTVFTWDTSRDSRVRDPAHTAMQGQQRKFGEPFVSGKGHLLIHPGDRNAPAEETVQCRCAVTVRFTDSAKQANFFTLVTH